MTTQLLVYCCISNSNKMLSYRRETAQQSIAREVETHCTIQDLIKQRKLKLFGRICRMKHERLVKTVMLGIVEGD